MPWSIAISDLAANCGLSCLAVHIDSVPSLLLICSSRLMCSINTAWLSVASSVAAMVVPAAHGARQGTELVAVSLAALFTVVGKPGQLTALSAMTCLLHANDQTAAAKCSDGQFAEWCWHPVPPAGMTAMIREKDVVYGLTLVWSLAAVFGGQVPLHH